MSEDLSTQMRRAAHAVASHALADAFGHVSARASASTALVSPPIPLGSVTDDDPLLTLDLESNELPPRAPREAWMHLSILRRRPEVMAICRAQPPNVAAWAALQRRLPALNGHAALLGEVAVYPDSRLVRDLESANAVAATLGSASALILRGNGALTVGPDLASAVAAMWLLERSSELALRATSIGEAYELPPDERKWWTERSGELLPRIYRFLAETNR